MCADREAEEMGIAMNENEIECEQCGDLADFVCDMCKRAVCDLCSDICIRNNRPICQDCCWEYEEEENHD